MRRVCLSILAGIAPSVVMAATTMFPVPTNAIDTGHVVISPGISEQDYFWISEKYPSSSALDHYKRVFSKWRPCLGREKEWWSFGDRSSGQERYIHQNSRHWVNSANDTAVTVVLKYDSNGLNYRISPDNDRQFVAIIRVKQRNASKMLVEMGATCEKDT